MFDEKTILARLQNGEDAQTIADEMAKMINAANKAYTDQKAAEEAARKAEELAKQKSVQKVEELDEILDLFAEWMINYYGISEEVMSELSAEMVIDAIDSLKEYMDALKNLEAMINHKAPVITKTAPMNTIIKSTSPDDTLDAFLKQMGW